VNGRSRVSNKDRDEVRRNACEYAWNENQ
jgi:hypothetical protein